MAWFHSLRGEMIDEVMARTCKLSLGFTCIKSMIYMEEILRILKIHFENIF